LSGNLSINTQSPTPTTAEINKEPEPEYTNTNTSAESAPVSTQQTEELYGLEVEPRDMNNWIQCPQCKRFSRNRR
jgi:hypothetical protein